MAKDGQFKKVIVAALVALVSMAGKANAAQCGSSSAGFESWKSQFAEEARGRGVGASGIAALMGTRYNSCDHLRRSWPEELPFVARSVHGETRRRHHRRAGARAQAIPCGAFSSIQQRYGVPPGPLLAIWGMETGFGAVHGNQNMLCRLWPHSPMTAVGRPISPISSTPL